MSGFDKSRVARLRDVMVRHVERDNAGGVAWLAARDGDVEIGVAGTLAREGGRALEPDSQFRIASMTKPITAVAAMILVEECRLRLDDLHAFGRMLLAEGRLPDGTRLVASAAIDAMTSDHIGVLAGAPGPSPDGSLGWGFGVGVQVRRTGLVREVGSYGWDGGLGSSWANDPSERLVGTILTTDAFTGPFLPAVIRDFWTCVYASLDD